MMRIQDSKSHQGKELKRSSRPKRNEILTLGLASILWHQQLFLENADVSVRGGARWDVRGRREDSNALRVTLALPLKEDAFSGRCLNVCTMRLSHKVGKSAELCCGGA